MNTNDDESVMDCHVDRKALVKGGSVIWESPRYGMKKGHITLGEWLDEKRIEEETPEMPANVIAIRRDKIDNVFGKTGTDD